MVGTTSTRGSGASRKKPLTKYGVTKPPRELAKLHSNSEKTTFLIKFFSGEKCGEVHVKNLNKQTLAREVNKVLGDGEVLMFASVNRKRREIWIAPRDLPRSFDFTYNRGILSLALSPDGKTGASWFRDKTVKLWNFQDGSLICTLEGHTELVNSVAFSPDGKTVASGSADKTVKLWNAQDGSLVRTLEGHTRAVAFSPDGKTVASGSDDNTVKLWNVQDGSLVRTLEGHTNCVSSVAFSPDGTTVASGSLDNTVKLWNVQDGGLVRTLEGPHRTVASVAFTPDGTTVVSGSTKGVIPFYLGPKVVVE